jgi:hypothetical protein
MMQAGSNPTSSSSTLLQTLSLQGTSLKQQR